MPLDSQNRQMPSRFVAEDFGEVNVRKVGDRIEVMFTVAMKPSGTLAEGWQTGVALDASASMRECFGQTLKGSLPTDVMREYERKGWITTRMEDGNVSKMCKPEAFEDGIRQGHLRFSENVIQPIAREFISYLADELDSDGGTTVVYWACGDGSAIDLVGDFTGAQCKTLELKGPTAVSFGKGTMLLPAVLYFVDRFRDAPRGMYLFLTDGRIDDLEKVKRYTIELAREVSAGKRKMLKCVLIGVGTEFDERQMEQLDDLDTGTDVDIWDHKIAKDMRSLVEIFAEVVDEHQIVAPAGKVYDAYGAVVKNLSDGVPTKVSFSMPFSSKWFELEIGGQRVRQSVVE